MIAIDWMQIGLGLLAGGLGGGLFFAGLALGLRLALASGRPGPVLILSAALRIAAVLALGWLVAQSGAAALAGFALAFLATRLVAITLARPSAASGAR